MVIKSQGLSDQQRAVIATMRMRLTRAQSLSYMAGIGFSISNATYGRMKAELKKNQLNRLHFIAAIGFEDQHLARIDNCELIEKLMWENYHLERSPFRRVMILKEIKELQPYISSYYEATKEVIKPNADEPGSNQAENNSISHSSAATREFIV